jgi:hypothetical protein
MKIMSYYDVMYKLIGFIMRIFILINRFCLQIVSSKCLIVCLTSLS